MCIEKTTVQAVTDLSDVDVFLIFFLQMDSRTWIQELSVDSRTQN